jgi:hypothetical protein
MLHLPLLFATCVLASPWHRRTLAGRDDKPTCHTFVPTSNRSSWEISYLPSRSRSSTSSDCNQSPLPCPVVPDTEGRLITWLTMYEAEGAQADVRDSNISAVLGEPYADEVSTDEYIELYVPAGQMGYLVASIEACHVPGMWRDCSDGQQYEGYAVVPNTKGVAHHVMIHN